MLDPKLLDVLFFHKIIQILCLLGRKTLRKCMHSIVPEDQSLAWEECMWFEMYLEYVFSAIHKYGIYWNLEFLIFLFEGVPFILNLLATSEVGASGDNKDWLTENFGTNWVISCSVSVIHNSTQVPEESLSSTKCDKPVKRAMFNHIVN